MKDMHSSTFNGNVVDWSNRLMATAHDVSQITERAVYAENSKDSEWHVRQLGYTVENLDRMILEMYGLIRLAEDNMGWRQRRDRSTS